MPTAVLLAPAILGRMRELTLTDGDLALACKVETEEVQRWLEGAALPLRCLLRVCGALSMSPFEAQGQPEPPPQVVSLLVGSTGRPARSVQEKAADDAGALVTLAAQLPLPSLVAPPAASADWAPFLAELRQRGGVAPRDAWTSSALVRLLGALGASVSPSLPAEAAAGRWVQVVRLPEREGRLVVFVPFGTAVSGRLEGLAQAVGVCLMGPDETSRPFARRLSRHLVTRRSTDDLVKLIDLGSEERFVDSARVAGMGLVMDAVERFQLQEGGRNHAFTGRALRVGLADAYALSGVLYPPFRARRCAAA